MRNVSHFSSLTKNKRTMKDIFIDNIQMETQTVFTQNGDIDIYPCGFELGQQIVCGASAISQRGRMETDDSGTSHFRPYRRESGHRYTPLFTTAHGEVKETHDDVIFQLRFAKRLGKTHIEAQHREESEEMQAFIRTRKEMAQW